MELHPLCSLFPRMQGAEFSALVNDIRTHGQREPIITHDGMILDGGNRYAACVQAGIKPVTIPYAGTDLVSFVLSANLHRRHLSAGQHAAIVASAQEWGRAHKRGGDRKSDQSSRSDFDSVAKRAEAAGVHRATQMRADTVARADPELSRQVAHGEISLPKAVEKVTGKRPGAKSVQPEPDPDAPHAADLLDEIQAENLSLQARVDALSVTDKAKKIDELMRLNDHYRREKDAEMDKNAILLKRANEAERFRTQVVEISGSGNPKAALQWVKAMAATQRKPAA